MSLVLEVDGPRWRRHLQSYAAANPGLVPVVKGNGYGFGLGRLARRTEWLKGLEPSIQTIAVGTYAELADVSSRFSGDLLVLTPWRPFGEGIDLADSLSSRVIHTVGRVEDLDGVIDHGRATGAPSRFVLERMTEMRRHGFDATTFRSLGERLRQHRGADHLLAGVAVHLPLAGGSHLAAVQRIVDELVAAELPTRTLWVSHLTSDELARLRAAYADFTIRPRVGTDLWLGDRGALRVSATVLDVHPVERGDAYGYRGRGAPRSGHLVIVSGGTAHGIGLEAPTGSADLKARAAALARGGLDAVGLVRSPFSIDGTQRLFAEPPHMQVSMLFLPAGARVPEIGDRVEVRVRFTATTVDRVEVS